MKKNIGFVAHSPATANSLYPLIREIRALHGVELHLYPYHPYVSNLWGVDKKEFFGEYPQDLSEMDLIVYGTGSSNPIEINVPIFCRNHNIPSIALHDIYWGESSDLIERYSNKPDFLVVPNIEAKAQLIDLDVLSQDRILPLGNPHFDRLARYVKAYPLGSTVTVAFFSQCSTTGDYSETHESSKQALLDLLAFNKDYPNVISTVYITPHPRECGTWLKAQLMADNIIYVPTGGTELMLTSDVIYGYSCTLQYEAQMIGKPVVFHKDKRQVYADLLNIQAYRAVAPKVSFDATSRCLALIQEVLRADT